MRFLALCSVAVLFVFAFRGGAHADARGDLAKEIREEISMRHMRCTVDYLVANDCGGDGIGDTCTKAMEVITDFKSELLNADTQKRAIYRWWKFVSSDSEPWNAGCMRSLLGREAYCKTVNLAVQFDPHRNCPDAGRTNSTCWLNRDFGTQRYLLPTEENDWVQRCKVDEPKRMEFEDAE